MCDVCSELLVLLDNFEERSQNGGFHMNKKEILSFVLYVCIWPQRQCMCCFKDFRNFEKLNSMVQDALSHGIRLIHTLPDDIEQEIQKEREQSARKNEDQGSKQHDTDQSAKAGEMESTDSTGEGETPAQELAKEKGERNEEENWTMDEKEKLLQFVTKVFLMNFPSYIAYKHIVHSSLEELSQQETSALNNYCEISDPEVPLFLLRNVCFFCDTNGIGALKQCFEKATPDSLPFNFAHVLITLIANLRLWMNIPTVIQNIVPLRTAVIRYMCKLSDKDLRMAGNRNMTELMWAAVKEPLETHFAFDKDGLDLAFKYFTCSTLTIRLTGIAQLNNQITLYNENCNNETLADAERTGHQLSQWLLDYKVIEHIFGPNLHVELIKQSQIILNFLAVEGRITNEHIDCIWAAAQLKHCGKQVFDTLIPLIKNLEMQPVQHLLKLVSALDVGAHTESTLYLASALVKSIWNMCTMSANHAAALQQQGAAYPGLEQEEEDTDTGICKSSKHELSSNESIQVAEEGELESKLNQCKPGTPEGSGEKSDVTESLVKTPKRKRHMRKSLASQDSDGVEESENESEGIPQSEDESGEEAEHCGCHHHYRVPHPHHHGHGVGVHRHHRELHHDQESCGSESDIETSESSECSHHEEGMDEEQRMKALTERIVRMQHKHRHHHHHRHHHGARKGHKTVHGESSEEVDPEEGEEEVDSEFFDSEDEEAKIAHLKHMCHQHSEESSDYEEAVEYQALLKRARENQAVQMMLANKRKQNLMKARAAKAKAGNLPTVISQDVHDDGVMKEELDNTSKTGEKEGEGEIGATDQPQSMDTEVFDCTETIKQMQEGKTKNSVYPNESIMSPDDGSCHSSRMSTKSEKNMADFDGEDLLSDDELAQINAHAHFTQMHLSNMASMYHTHMPHVIHHRPSQKETVLPTCAEFSFEEVCKPGNTLLWDLVQEDKSCLLPEGLALEAEKALCSLVCFCTDKKIKMKFIEACIENVAHHRSVVVSLRLLPKILSAFQQYRNGVDTHTVTMWAEKELGLMAHFFIDLVYYTEVQLPEKITQTMLYSHKEAVQVRLLFLTCVFSSSGSPDNFRLSLEQVDTLWSCLALDRDCSDECLSWFLNQAKSKDHHAMGLETFKHIFLEKMPQLNPETMSMIGLNLFQQLSHLSRIASSNGTPFSEDQVSGMDQLWNIALRAENTDVSITAIQFLNSYYINYGNGLLEKEGEFVARCMDSLVKATQDIQQNPDTSLLVVQRGLVLMKNHLDSFRKRYAFHLRNWQLDSQGIVSHQRSLLDKQSSVIRVLLQPTGMGEKTPLLLCSTDLIAELRAEVTRWWELLQKQLQRQQGDGELGASVLTPILGAMLGDRPIRMITQGQELTSDVDEKTLGEMQFKETQLILVSVGASRPPRKIDGTLPCSSLPAPPRDRIPMMLLNKEPYFDQLLTMLEKLSKLDLASVSVEGQERWGLQTKSRVLSRKVWELLMLLPTNSVMLEGFKSVTSDKNTDSTPDWKKLLDAHSPHRLMYSLQIVEGLSRGPKHRKKSLARSGAGDSEMTSTESELSVDEGPAPEELWSKMFITKGGLSHMFNIFKSGSLQMNEYEAWSQWDQECLAFLLRLITQFSIDQSDVEAGHDDVFETYESPRKKLKKQKGHDKISIPRLDQAILSMLNVDAVLKILMKILYDAAIPGDSNQVHAGSWGRTEVVHYSLSFLVSWAFSSDEVRDSLCSAPNFDSWLKRLTLEAPEPHVRREACAGIYRLCLGKTVEGKTGYPFLLPILSSLLRFLKDALQFKPHKNFDVDVAKEKEPYGPGCRDYFWLTCRFVESISKADASPDSSSPVKFDDLSQELAQHIIEREYHETRHGYEEDDALIGLLNLSTAIFKHNPPFKSSSEVGAVLDAVFESLFSLPSPVKRYLPKCKSQTARSGAYDLLVELVKGNMENYKLLHTKMLLQHTKDSHAAYPWDYWPHEDGRSKCGYVGLTNLGATCYMATCMQHLYMIPQARQSVLQAKVCSRQTKHEGTLLELQKMFAYLQESERKAYNPRGFCKAYTMDKQPLNTGEQKDMTEFFTDLITKLEEMSAEMKKLVKSLFGGVITNNVVSLDCPHVSRTLEEFYTVRCQVTDMKNLYESLDEVTVKDMLEGDNMYTCSKCTKKVRAEKRACFKKLPRIICFNTMRYTFNMVTMMKEKVNTHFSFPLRLDMSDYMEQNLISSDKLQQDDDDEDGFIERDCITQDEELYEYELIGVTVHTGTADGGHYYSFIRDRMNKSDSGQDKWFLFNDAEVKSFDPSQIATECFGGEMTSKTYDSVTEKFMDFSFEKTNSAYMLFYERCLPTSPEEEVKEVELSKEAIKKFNFELSKELEEWIWQDNMQFLQDKNIIEHTYFDFMWQVCAYIPTTLPKNDPLAVSLRSSQLSTSFVLETFIHAKEKPTMVQWIELLTKQFNSCQGACEWFLDHMAESDWWPQQILIKCPNQMVRQMFQRLLIHVISRLKPAHLELYLQPYIENEDGEIDMKEMGNKSCVTRFIKKMLSILEHGVRPHSKYLMEYFAFLFEFAKMGDQECLFLIHTNAISSMVAFYMGQKAQENYVEILSDDEEEEEVIPITEETYKPMSLDKMIALISLLVEKSRGEDNQLQISDKDYNSIIGGKGFPFLFNQVRDNINVRQTCNLVFSLCRWNERLPAAIIQMIFGAIKKLNPELSQPFFKLMSMLVEFVGGPPGMPPFTQYILQRFWELALCTPQQCLDWMSTQVTRNKLANAWVLNQMDNWVEHYLVKHNNVRVRNAAGLLLVSLVPSNHFRQAFRSTRSVLSPHKEISMTHEAILTLHKIYEHLLGLLPHARFYVEPQTHGTTKLMCYFTVMTYCLISKTEKLMFSRYFLDLWQLFQPKLSEPQISMHHNKQALLLFWYQACVDCPENIKLIVNNAHVCKHIPFTYILADHEDQDVMMFNRVTLPAYYGLLRMCCQQSAGFTRQLAQHQNILWAFKNISPYPGQYPGAVEELFKMMRLMSTKYPDSTEEEQKSINGFKRSTILLYLQNVDARSGWQTLISAFKILVESMEDRLLLIYNQGLPTLTEAFYTLHVMYHEATACHVVGDIVDLLSILLRVLQIARHYIEKKSPQAGDVKTCLFSWKERLEVMKKLLTLLNSYTPPEIRLVSIDVLKELVLTYQSEVISVMVPVLTQAHISFQDSNMPMSMGPYFPRRGQKPIGPKSNIRPPRPQFNMLLHSNQIEASRGVDDIYDMALSEFFIQYHSLVDLMCRVAVNQQILTEPIINLSAMVAYEGVPLHSPYFAKLWYEIYHTEVDKNCIKMLCNSSFFIDYVDAVLMDERLSLNNQNIYQFFLNFFPKVYQQVLSDQGRQLLDSLVASITAEKSALENMKTERELMTIFHRINGDLRALLLIFSVQQHKHLNPLLVESLQYIMQVCREHQQQRAEVAATLNKAIQQRRRQSSQCGPEEEPSSEESGETPSKRRRMSGEKGEEEEASKTSRSTEAEEKEAESQETCDKTSPPAASDNTAIPAEEEKGTEKEISDCDKTVEEKVEEKVKEMDASPTQPRAESPQPSTSKQSDEETQPSTSKQSDEETQNTEERERRDSGPSTRNDSGEEETMQRARVPRERPSLVDLVAKHIESLFSLLAKHNS